MNHGICYLIQCHNNPDHVLRIIKALSAEDAYFVISVDKKSVCDFSEIEKLRNAYFVPSRIGVTWGDISVIDSVLNLSEYALTVVPNAEYYNLLSGADYPVKSHSYIKKYLSQQAKKNFIRGMKIPSKDAHWLEGGRRRVAAYVIPLNNHNNATIEPRTLTIGNIRQLIKICLVNIKQIPHSMNVLFNYPKRIIPYNLDVYAGEMWWTLSNETLQKVIDWNAKHPDYYKYHLNSQVPDEMYINTIVWNFDKSVTDDIKRYISWVNITDKSPRWMTYEDDYDTIKEMISNPDVLFVRKLQDKRLIDEIDKSLT